MAVIALPKKETLDYDLKNAMTKRKFDGLWRLMTGFRSTYFGAAASLGVATVARTVTFLLLAYFIDTYLTEAAQPALQTLRTLGEATRSEALAGLSPREVEQLHDLLSRVRNNLSGEDR